MLARDVLTLRASLLSVLYLLKRKSMSSSFGILNMETRIMVMMSECG
jgi:hypothetical protein